MKTLVAGMRSTGNRRLLASLAVAAFCHGAWGAAASTRPTPPVTLAATGDSPATPQPPPPATLRLANREIVVLRATFQGHTPEERVQRVRERARKFTPETIAEPIRVLPITIADDKGVQFVIGDSLLLAVLEGDVDPETRQSFDALVKQTQARLEDARTAWLHANDRSLLIRSLLKALAATVLLGLLLWIAHRYTGRLVAWMEKWRDAIAALHTYVDLREFLARAVVGSLQIVRVIILLALVYAWLIFVLGCFDYTAPIADILGDWLWDRLLWLGDGVWNGVPGLITVLIVLAFTRLVVDAVRYFFDAVQRGRLRLPMFHPETTVATRRIVTLLVWGLGIAAAYPYLPGANTDAFKGLSVLFGLMITLGSAGLVTQAMSGLVIIYSRALQKGDFVDINGVQGVVSEVSSLATKVINVRNEEITVPNSVVISSPIRNYSKLGSSQGTLITTKVTIGYDAPWRQVHALLVGAAQKTQGVRPSPTPYVYQLALSDFYVEYELFASIDRPIERVPVLSLLHANIQDAFNEAGVQIMSPHYLAQPDEAVVVPRSRWYAPPARPPVDGPT